MKNKRLKFFSLFSILLICSGSYLPIFSSINKNTDINTDINTENDIKIDTGIDVDYLENLPKNDYIVGPGDTLQISVSREYPELITISTIDAEGTIYLPFINRVYIDKLSLNELNNVLTNAFKKYVKYPYVEVRVLTYRPVRILVDGEVENPGLQTLQGSLMLRNVQSIQNNFKNNLDQLDDSKDESDFSIFPESNSNLENSSYYFPTVFDAIQKSGGITPYSDLSNIEVIRNNNISNGGGRITAKLNFERVILDGDNSQNIRIYDSDVIKINKSNNIRNDILKKATLSNLNPKFIKVFVAGRVDSPGEIKVAKASNLNDALDFARPKVMKGKVRFVRFENDGTIDKRKFRYSPRKKRGSYQNPLLKNGDVIIVGENIFTLTNEVINEITSPFLGLLSTYAVLEAIRD